MLDSKKFANSNAERVFWSLRGPLITMLLRHNLRRLVRARVHREIDVRVREKHPGVVGPQSGQEMSNSWTASARTWATSKRTLRNPCNHYSIGLQGNLESEKAGKLYADDFAEDLSGALNQSMRRSDRKQMKNT